MLCAFICSFAQCVNWYFYQFGNKNEEEEEYIQKLAGSYMNQLISI